MLGGSELTTDHTCGRHETVEECGEQPPEPRRIVRDTGKVAGGRKGEMGAREDKREQKVTPCTSYSTFPLQALQPPQQPQAAAAAAAAVQPAMMCASSAAMWTWPEAPEKSGVCRVTTCEWGGLDRDESGDAGEEPGRV